MGVIAAALLTVVSLAGAQPFDSLALAQGRPQFSPAQPVPQTGLILGRVVDAASGRPVSGASVSAAGDELFASSESSPHAAKAMPVMAVSATVRINRERMAGVSLFVGVTVLRSDRPLWMRS